MHAEERDEGNVAMKRLLSSTIVLLLLAVPACKWLHNPVANDEPREKGPHPDIPIIRPGMTPQEIEALMGRGVIEEAPGLGKGRAIGTYRDIKVDYLNDRVLSCSSRPLTISEPNKGPTVQLYLLEKIMALGNDASGGRGDQRPARVRNREQTGNECAGLSKDGNRGRLCQRRIKALDENIHL